MCSGTYKQHVHIYRFILKAFSICSEICVIIIVSPRGWAYKMVCTFTIIPLRSSLYIACQPSPCELSSGFCLSKLKKPCLLSTHSMAMSLALVLWDSELRDCHHIIKCVPLEGLVLVRLIFWPRTQASFSQFCVPPLLQQKCIPI